MKRNNFNTILLALIVISSGCTGSKYLADGERYYSGAIVHLTQNGKRIHNQELELDLQEIIEPSANTKVLGSRPAVWFYNIAGEPKKDRGFKHWLKYAVGKEPVLVSDAEIDHMATRLKNYLINKGYFNVQVDPDYKLRSKSGKAIYKVRLGTQYTLRDINCDESDSLLCSVLLKDDSNESLLVSGNPYDLEVIKAEQTRLEDYLENRGFYYFDDTYLVHEADSAAGDHQVDLTLTLSESTPKRATDAFRYHTIFVNPDYTIDNDTTRNKKQEQFYNYTFLNNDDYIRPDILSKTIVFKQGNLYSQEAELRTRERLMGLGTYKYVDLKYTQKDSALLNTQIYLTPLPKKSLRLDAQAVSKSNNFIGPALSVSFQNRNAFRGAEMLELSVNSSYEVQVGGQNNPPLTAYELNLEGSLTIPRLITPFNFDYRSLRFIPQTRMSLGARLQSRVNVFQITSLEGKYGFLWQETYTKRHSLYPLNLSYLQLSQTSEDFDLRLSGDPNLARSLEDQFIAGALYDYTFNTKNALDAKERRNHFYFNGLLDISGNLINVTDRIINGDKLKDGNRATYSQYTKVQLDFRYYRKFGERKELATRFLAGVARAYGNSNDVPFIKQFSSGGSTSIRAFRARSVGPGRFNPIDDSSLILDETGDIKFEANIEYRAPIAGFFEGALFIDAGNVWLWDARPQKPGGNFTTDFIQDIAIGGGAGLRMNFNVFILRFDLAFPLRTTSTWVVDKVNPLKKEWRRDQLLLNIAIGYPF